MKKIGIIIAVILVLSIVLVSAKNIIAKHAVSAGVKAIAGLDLDMKSMDVGVFKSLIGIKELKLYNSSGFPDKLMVDMPEIYVDYDLGAFFRKKVHLEEVRLNLNEFVVVKNEKGELNLNSLKVVQAKKQEKTSQKKKEKAKMPELKIDLLELKIGKVIFKDYSQGGQPKVREFNVNIDERYENITDPNTFASLIVTKALMNTTIANLTNFDLGLLKEGLSGTLKTATKTAAGAVDKVLDVGAEAGTKTGDAVKEEVGKAADKIRKILPFGE